MEDALKAHQLPKVDVFGDQLFVVARPASLEQGHIRYDESAIFVGKHHIISVRHGSARAHIEVRRQLEALPALLSQGADYVLHGVLDFIVDGYLLLVESIEEEVLEMEQRALNGSLGRDEVARIFRMRRELIRFQRILGPMAELCSKLSRLDMPCVDLGSGPIDCLWRRGSV